MRERVRTGAKIQYNIRRPSQPQPIRRPRLCSPFCRVLRFQIPELLLCEIFPFQNLLSNLCLNLMLSYYSPYQAVFRGGVQPPRIRLCRILVVIICTRKDLSPPGTMSRQQLANNRHHMPNMILNRRSYRQRFHRVLCHKL